MKSTTKITVIGTVILGLMLIPGVLSANAEMETTSLFVL